VTRQFCEAVERANRVMIIVKDRDLHNPVDPRFLYA
jgi:hypothetical protein